MPAYHAPISHCPAPAPARPKGQRPGMAVRVGVACGALALAALAQAETPDAVQAQAPLGWNLQALQQLNNPDRLDLTGLAHAWRLAQQHDPEYRQAVSERLATQTERRQGRAQLLPEIQAGYYRGKSRGTRNLLNAPPANANSPLRYDSETTYVRLVQPVFDYGSYAGYQRGVALAQQGEAQFRVDLKERLLVLAEIYLTAFLAREKLGLSEALAASLEKQAAAQLALFEQNEADRIGYEEVKARLSLAQADVVLARDAWLTALRELESRVGRRPDSIAGPGETLQPSLPQPPSLQRWLDKGRARNPELGLARASLRVADTDLQRARAQYMPQLDFVASWNRADSENLSTLSEQSNTYQLGLNLSIPLFTGGYATAANARARETQRQRNHEVAAAQQVADIEVTRHYTAVVSTGDRIRALMTAVESGTLALEAAQAGQRYGAVSNVDVLKRQDTLYEARHQLVQARVEHALAHVALHAAAGEIDENTLSIHLAWN